MIPRYSPTNTYYDLVSSLMIRDPNNIRHQLCSELSKIYDVKHVFLLASARVALYVLLKAFNRPGGVILPAYTCIVVPEAIYLANYHPVFTDIDYSSLIQTHEQFQGNIFDESTVALATHIFGIPCDIANLVEVAEKKNLFLVEDAAPAIGAQFQGKMVGTFGKAAIISFQSTKVISAEGGGALLTNDDELAEKVNIVLKSAIDKQNDVFLFVKALLRKFILNKAIYPLTHKFYSLLRDEKMYEYVTPEREQPENFLSLCSKFDSALVLRQMKRLRWNLSRRRKLGQIYAKELSNSNPNFSICNIQNNCSPSWIQFPILVNDKSAFYKYMQQKGVDLSWTYRYSCAVSYEEEGFPNAERAAKTVLGLPTYPSLTDEQAYMICEIAKKYPYK